MADTTSWLALNNAVKEAISRGDFAEGERLLEQLREVSRRRGEPELECNTHFTAGLLRDAAGDYASAEESFLAALVLDRQLKGPVSAAAADTLNSIGIVRSNAGNREGALEAYREAAEIYRVVQPFEHARALKIVGRELLESDRLDEALKVFEEAIKAAEHPLTPAVHAAEALLGAGEVLRRTKRFPEAVGRLARATRHAHPGMSAGLQRTMANGWYTLGLASLAIQDGGGMAALSFWYAQTLGGAELAQKAAERLAELPLRHLATGDPNLFRVAFFNDKGNVDVSSAVRGLHFVKSDLEVELGQRVEVTWEEGRVTAIQRAN